MCGIVGLHLKNPDLQPRLGELLSVMLGAMTTRGPDSAGIAVYADPAVSSGTGSGLQYSLRSETGTDWDLLGKAIAADTDCEVRVRRLGRDSAVLESGATEALFLAAVRRAAPDVTGVGDGHSMVLVKGVGAPAGNCSPYGIPGLRGLHARRHPPLPP